MGEKVSEWPRVLPNDAGIRPAGDAGKCFYCHARIGQMHGSECVCVCKRVKYDVMIEGIKIGTFERDDPHFWTADDCNFHKNDSSWCADNALDAIVWTSKEGKDRLSLIGKTESDMHCACPLLEFRFVAVTDEGPFIDIREEESAE